MTQTHPLEPQKAIFKVEGMDCASCVRSVEGAVGRLPGVQEFQVNLVAEKLSVSFDSSQTRLEDFARVIEPLGYTVKVLEGVKLEVQNIQQDTPAEIPWWNSRAGRPVLMSGVLLGLAYLFGLIEPQWAQWGYIAATVVGGAQFARAAYQGARVGHPFSIQTLMTVAALGAILIGEAPEAAVVVFLFAVGELLEGVAAGRARAGIRALAALAPKTAFLLEGSVLEGSVTQAKTEREVSVDALQVGHLVRVKPGGRVPGDGTILEGFSSLDDSPVTGESVPVNKGVGELVYAGSINGDGALTVRIERPSSDNTISRIIKLVEEAESSKAPTARFIDRFSRVYTPLVMLVSALVIVVPPLFLGGVWQEWIYKGLSLLLIGCPCALLISVPAAITSGLSSGARRGLLIKGGAALETLGSVKTVAFDKTGTLTVGKPRVTQIVALAGSELEILGLAASVEAFSSHPLALAILDKAKIEKLELVKVSEAQAIQGKAAIATLVSDACGPAREEPQLGQDSARPEGRTLVVGSPRYALELGTLTDGVKTQIAALEGQGQTVVVLLENGTAKGLIALRDEARADAAQAVLALKKLGLESLMLTGDNARTAKAIGQILGLAFEAELLPQDKLERIRTLQKAGKVAMIGDGINDAPALALSDVGLAMGGGTDVALETADGALLRGTLMGVVEAVQLSRATMSNIRQNIAIALGLKLLFLVTTLTGATGLPMAILADTGATVLVTVNALRLLGWRPGRL
jgi:Zn2+/Cd2+-exporting ATPase